MSLVALQDDKITGHVAFSPVVIGDDQEGWFGLGPVSVRPALQGQGIGSTIINAGLEQLREMNALGCALIGDPNYYHRFGFVSDGRIHYGSVSDEIVQYVVFGSRLPQGELKFSRAFDPI